METLSILKNLPDDIILEVFDHLSLHWVNEVIHTGGYRFVRLLQPYLISRISNGYEGLGVLLYATSSGDKRLTSLLLQNSQNITMAQEIIQDDEEETIVTYKSPGQPIFRFLLEDEELKFYDQTSESAALHWAIRNSDYRTTQSILKSFKCTCDTYSNCMLHIGGTLDEEAPAELQFPSPLLYPCMTGNLRMVQLILSFTGFPHLLANTVIAGKDLFTGRTALHLACINGNDEVLKLILNSGNAAGGQRQVMDDSGMTPIDYAVKYKHRELVRRLAMNTRDRFNYEDPRNRTVLMIAAAHCFNDLAEEQIEISQDDPEGKDSTQMTPLHYAAAGSNAVVTKMLLKMGVFVDPTDHIGRTPLHIAARLGNVKVLRQLLGRGARQDVIDDYGMTPLHLACKRGSIKIVEMLLRAGSQKYINVVDKFRRTPLHICARHRSSSAACELLVKNGADLTALDVNGKPPRWPMVKKDK
ncbi:uncharacterized protein H6S33_012099 [Morchella sextelata]|uniref:uncharacterized protein n=1 Tax=Morchella sextelata TaxID=1174677 RepID=UPI001D05479D|nr:uncharacterized protein H6S33_012099 [Morchella sextelata]KAH0610572.1 hypothetical protein H6S33_012099 [Morchella sextelata]